MADKKVSVIRQNFHAETEAVINKQINLELYASYVYQSMVRIIFKILKNIFFNYKNYCFVGFLFWSRWCRPTRFQQILQAQLRRRARACWEVYEIPKQACRLFSLFLECSKLGGCRGENGCSYVKVVYGL